ncbi:MAG: redoxin family protein [Alphaproteobacteria bacterium]|nr:redoxin family protein [Alphaproteobacteria bacterium]
MTYLKYTSLFCAIFLGSVFAEAKVSITSYSASWCPTCSLEFDFFNKLLKEHPNDVSVNGVIVDRDQKEGEAYIAKHNPNYPITYDTHADLPKLPIIKVTKNDGTTETFDAFNDSVKASIEGLIQSNTSSSKKEEGKNG